MYCVGLDKFLKINFLKRTYIIKKDIKDINIIKEIIFGSQYL